MQFFLPLLLETEVMTYSRPVLWILWILLMTGLTGYFIYTLLGDDWSMYLVGQTTAGHYQIELVCAACHTEPFGGMESLQKS